MDVRAAVVSLGGCAHTSSLLALGVSESALTRAVRAGDVLRPRRGWYVSGALSDPVTRAVRAGGRLTGISAIQQWGGWVLGPRPLHVSVPENSARLRPTPGVILHWDARDVGERGTTSSVGMIDALARVVLDDAHESAVAALDWALFSGNIEEADLPRIAALVPHARRSTVCAADPLCESLPESLTRTRLRRSGHAVRSQVPLGSTRIDLVVDGRVGIETDGEEFHRDTFERDRRKDIAMVRASYFPLRVPARMVFYEWPVVLRAVDEALAWSPPRPR